MTEQTNKNTNVRTVQSRRHGTTENDTHQIKGIEQIHRTVHDCTKITMNNNYRLMNPANLDISPNAYPPQHLVPLNMPEEQ